MTFNEYWKSQNRKVPTNAQAARLQKRYNAAKQEFEKADYELDYFYLNRVAYDAALKAWNQQTRNKNENN